MEFHLSFFVENDRTMASIQAEQICENVNLATLRGSAWIFLTWALCGVGAKYIRWIMANNANLRGQPGSKQAWKPTWGRCAHKDYFSMNNNPVVGLSGGAAKPSRQEIVKLSMEGLWMVFRSRSVCYYRDGSKCLLLPISCSSPQRRSANIRYLAVIRLLADAASHHFGRSRGASFWQNLCFPSAQ